MVGRCRCKFVRIFPERGDKFRRERGLVELFRTRIDASRDNPLVSISSGQLRCKDYITLHYRHEQTPGQR